MNYKLRYAALLIMAFLLLWAAVCVSLPFGNHLAAMVLLHKLPRSEKNAFETYFHSRLISLTATKITGISCNADVVVNKGWFDFSFSKFDNGSIGGSITLYNETKDSKMEVERLSDRLLIRHLIEECDPNLSASSIPPLVDAIFTEEEEFVQALLARGADAHLKFRTNDGLIRTPLGIAERLAEIEVVRLQENPDHPQATGKAQRILDLILAHIAENP